MPAAESAFQQQIRALYSDHHGWLFNWLRRRLGCADNAADVAQDTFVRIIASRDALLGSELALAQPRAYLATVSRRLLIDRARRQALERAYLAELASLAADLPGMPSPEETLAALQALDEIGAALARVSAKARQAFLLHYLEGLSQAAVAERLGVSARMVQKYLVRCLLQCRLAGQV